MKTAEKMVMPAKFEDVQDSITIVYDEHNTEYWCANDLNKFVPEKRLDVFMKTQDAAEYIAAVERTIIPPNGGIITKKGKGGGTYFHRLVALRFAAWLSKDFELAIYLFYDQARPKHEAWSKERALTKYEYRLMTDAIREHVVPKYRNETQRFAYSNEAKMLNEIVFGKRKFDSNPRESATIEQLDVIRQLERYNATFIEMEMSYDERKTKLFEFYQKKFQKLVEA